MATTNIRKNGDGSTSFVGQVRVKGFRPTSKTFHERDYASRKLAEKAALAWGEAQEKELRDLRNRGSVRADVSVLTFAGLVDEYLRDPETQKLATFHERQRQLGWWVNLHGSVKALEFCSAVRLRDAREQLRKDLAAGSVNRFLAAARACVNFGRASGLLPADKCVWPPRLLLTEPKGRQRFLSADELKLALDAALQDQVIGGELMRCAVMFAVGVGCRQSEQLRVRWGDIDEKTATVAITVSKTDTSRRAHCPPAVLEALRALRTGKVVSLARASATAYVFADHAGKPIRQHALVDAWQRLRKVAKLDGLRWHDLRHSAASFLAAHGASLSEIAQQLGHKSIQTTARYSHLTAGRAPTGAAELDKKLRG